MGDAAFDEIFHPIALRLVGKCDAVSGSAGRQLAQTKWFVSPGSYVLKTYRALDEVPGCEVT